MSRCFAIALVVALFFASPAQGGSDSGEESGPDDKKDRYQILPIPIFITEPAIGNGLGVALTLFHPIDKSEMGKYAVSTPTSINRVDDDIEPPPVVTGVFGAYTSNKTWVAGVGHSNHWRDDSIRYSGLLGGAGVNSEFFVFGFPVRYSLDGVFLYQDVKFRLGGSHFFLGTALSYLDADIGLGRNGGGEPPVGLVDANVKDIGLALRGFYDTRNNVLDPTRGRLIDLSTWRYDNALGGNYDYWSIKLKALSFHDLSDKLTLGFRLEVAAVSGSPPFFSYPWVKLRGIPAMRYQDERAGAVEAEIRYRLAHRWQVLGFGGLGFTSDVIPVFENPRNIYNFGVGARYQVLPSHKVWMGLDIARGPEEWNVYIQVGHPW